MRSLARYTTICLSGILTLAVLSRCHPDAPARTARDRIGSPGFGSQPSSSSPTSIGRVRRILGPHGTFSLPDPGPRWRCGHESNRAHRLGIVKCKPRAPGKLFFVMVKGFDDGTSAKRRDFKRLFNQVFILSYRRLFAAVKIVSQGPVKVYGYDGYTVRLAAHHLTMGAITVQETGFKVGNRIFLLSLSGDAARFKRLAPEMRRWLQDLKLEIQ